MSKKYLTTEEIEINKSGLEFYFHNYSLLKNILLYKEFVPITVYHEMSLFTKGNLEKYFIENELKDWNIRFPNYKLKYLEYTNTIIRDDIGDKFRFGECQLKFLPNLYQSKIDNLEIEYQKN